jgi:hypothetical protein
MAWKKKPLRRLKPAETVDGVKKIAQGAVDEIKRYPNLAAPEAYEIATNALKEIVSICVDFQTPRK